MQAVTTATVQFAVNYVPQCFYANDPYSVLSRFIIIKSLCLYTLCFVKFKPWGRHLWVMQLCLNK